MGSVESFVFSLNKKRKRKHLREPHLPRGVQGGDSCVGWRRLIPPWESCPGPSGDGEPSPGNAAACQGTGTFLALRLLQVLGVFS